MKVSGLMVITYSDLGRIGELQRFIDFLDPEIITGLMALDKVFCCFVALRIKQGRFHEAFEMLKVKKK